MLIDKLVFHLKIFSPMFLLIVELFKKKINVSINIDILVFIINCVVHDMG